MRRFYFKVPGPVEFANPPLSIRSLQGTPNNENRDEQLRLSFFDISLERTATMRVFVILKTFSSRLGKTSYISYLPCSDVLFEKAINHLFLQH